MTQSSATSMATPSVRLSLVVAMARNRVIGRDGALPWRMPGDLRRFRRLTLGCPVVMGRKTFLSIGRPLDGRANIVVSRDPAFRPEGVTVAGSLQDAIDIAGRAVAGAGEIMVIGGGEVYAASLPLASRIYLTVIEAEPAGDTRFPELGPEWAETSREPIEPDPRDDHAAVLVVFERSAAIASGSPSRRVS